MAVTIAVLGVFYFTTTQGLSAAPSTTITSLDSVQHNLASGGKTRLISFYSPDCPISRRDVANLNDLQSKFGDEPFDIIAVAMSYDDMDTIELFEKSQPADYSLAHDADGSIAAAFQGVRFTPTSFLIDESGNIVWRHTGKMPLQRVSTKIESLLNDPKIAQLAR